jgi:hypothetical protein
MNALHQHFSKESELQGDLETAMRWFEKELGVDALALPPVRPP